MNNNEYIEWFAPNFPLYRNFKVSVYDTVLDLTERKVAMHAKSSAVTGIGDYNNEYVLILHLTEDGTKVEKFVEFADSGYSAKFMDRLRRHHSQQENPKL
ncbi:MAG: hypothetical protein Q9190_002303 [Brigantiaea leucoxantha]